MFSVSREIEATPLEMITKKQWHKYLKIHHKRWENTKHTTNYQLKLSFTSFLAQICNGGESTKESTHHFAVLLKLKSKQEPKWN